MDDHKVASAMAMLDKQASLLRELHSFANKQAKTAAALAQAVKLAEDGLIDVNDIRQTAQRVLSDGTVKLSAVDDLFRLTPGTLVEVAQNAEPGRSLDPLTRVLRDLSGPATHT